MFALQLRCRGGGTKGVRPGRAVQHSRLDDAHRYCGYRKIDFDDKLRRPNRPRWGSNSRVSVRSSSICSMSDHRGSAIWLAANMQEHDLQFQRPQKDEIQRARIWCWKAGRLKSAQC